MSGEEEEELEDWLLLLERLRPGTSEALAGGEDPRGEGFWGEVDTREAGCLEDVALEDSSFGVAVGGLEVLVAGAVVAVVERGLTGA